MSAEHAEKDRLLRLALPHVIFATTHWEDWAGEQHNRQLQREARELEAQIRTHLDGGSDG